MNKLLYGVLMIALGLVYLAMPSRCSPSGGGSRLPWELSPSEREAIAGDRLAPDGSFNAMVYRDWVLGMIERGEHEKAAEEIVWLWRYGAVLDGPFVGVRGSYLLRDIRSFIEVYPPVLGLFREARDEIEVDLAGPRTSRREKWDAERSRRDWMTLNDLLGDRERTLAWVESLGPGDVERLYSRWAADEVVRRLMESARADLVTRAVQNPTQHFERAMEFHDHITGFQAVPQVNESTETGLGQKAGSWYISLVRSGDQGMGDRVVGIVFEPGRGVDAQTRAVAFADALQRESLPVPPLVMDLLP